MVGVVVHWTAPRQDLSRIDGIEGEAVCHLFPEFDDYSFCGVPREEQETHGQVERHVENCNVCSLRRCPVCREHA